MNSNVNYASSILCVNPYVVSRASLSSKTNSVSMAFPAKTHTQTPISINAIGQLPHKLTSSNFPSWSATLYSLLLDYDLMGFLDGTHPFPAPYAHSSRWRCRHCCLLQLVTAKPTPSQRHTCPYCWIYHTTYRLNQDFLQCLDSTQPLICKQVSIPREATQGAPHPSSTRWLADCWLSSRWPMTSYLPHVQPPQKVSCEATIMPDWWCWGRNYYTCPLVLPSSLRCVGGQKNSHAQVVCLCSNSVGIMDTDGW